MTSEDSAGLSESQYALRRKELLTLLKKLRASGSQDELDLPRIAVIGNQSAGKSSVVEAISGITVPRDAGTCTRCPMECRMTSSSAKWTCSISIRSEYGADGSLLPVVKELPFGKSIYDKEEVELQLRRAQVAVLNPHLEFSDIMTAQSAEHLSQAPFHSKKTLKFSRNTICIDLDGPGLVDLAFVDLPGIIQNAEPDIVKLVEDMVIHHIRGNCIILVALPMTDDIENQRAMRLAKQEDPKGHRTIGVITKPDMLGSGATKARDLWLDVIEGRREPLLHGYYCTKQPDDAQRAAKISINEARRLEREFFDKTHPWAASSHKDRFGTPQLIDTLSKLLVGIINSTLPRIRNEAALKLEKCTRELSNLPQAIEAEPATYMLTLINEFSASVKKYIQGGGAGSNSVIHKNRDAYMTLKGAIRSTAPNFIPIPRSAAREGTADESSKAEPMYVDDMKNHIDSCIARELPNNVPYSGKEVLIVQFQDNWENVVESCFNSVRSTVQDMLEKHVQKYFYRYENLEGHIRVFVAEIVQKHYDTCLAVLKPIIAVEQSPFTQNTHYLSESTEKWLTIYKGIRSGKRPLRKKRKVAISSARNPSQAFVFGVPGGSGSADPAKSSQKKAESTGSSAPSKDANPFNAFSAYSNVPKPLSAFSSGSAQFTFAGNKGSSAELPSSPAATTTRPTKPRSSRRQKQTNGSQKTNPESKTDSSSEEETPKTNRKRPAAAEIHSVHGSDSEESDSSSEDEGHRGVNGTQGGSNGATLLPDDERTAKVNQLLASLAELGYTGLKEENLAKLAEPDLYERELAAMAEVRGYFQIAYKRVIDNVPNLIDCLFVKPIGEDVAPSLITMLALGTQDANERCAVYLSESPAVVKKRSELTSRKRRLEEVKNALQTFGLS